MSEKKLSNRKKKKLNDELNFSKPSKISKMNASISMSNRLSKNFYNLPSYELAQQLLGKLFVRKIDSIVCKGRIVETECYPGGDDRASCTFNGKRTTSNEPLYHEPGTLFVYMTYGMYYCMNISASEPGGGVLLRALEPLEGVDYMTKWRIAKTKSKKNIKIDDLCNGPSKLCTSFQITKADCNMVNLVEAESIWIEDDPDFTVKDVVHANRVGIDSAGKEWVDKLYRFYILGSNCISKRDVSKENLIINEEMSSEDV